MDLHRFPSAHPHIKEVVDEFADAYRKTTAWSLISLQRDKPHDSVAIKPKGEIIQAWHFASDLKHSHEYHLGDDRIIYRNEGSLWTVVSIGHYANIAREHALGAGISSDIENSLVLPRAILQQCADFAIQKQGAWGAKELEMAGASAA